MIYSLRIILLLLLLSISACTMHSTERNPFELTLQTLEGKRQTLKPGMNHKATVFVFLLPDCPACQSYSLTLNNLNKKYKEAGVSFIGVVPGNYCTPAEIADFIDTYKISFPIYTDSKNILVRCLKASIVPEAFLVSDKGQTVYSGRIDDWMVALGKKRQVITTNELRDAIDATVNNQPVKVKTTRAIGCFIE